MTAARRAALAAVMVAMAVLLLAISVAQTRPPQSLLPDAQRLQQTARQRYGAQGAQQVRTWLDMLARSRSLPEAEKIQAVNAFWNQAVHGAEDIDIWNQVDYWATPLESLGRRRGDCEDYVIGKYFSLVALGVPAEKLRFIYVKASMGGPGSRIQIAHMVLGYYGTPNAVPLVLAGGPGSASRATIGIVIIFGVLFSTVLSLLVVPAFYALLAPFTRSPEVLARELESLEQATPQVG